MATNNPRPGTSQRPQTDWLFRLPPFLRFFIVRTYWRLQCLRMLARFFVIDVVMLAFVRRGKSDAVLIVKNGLLGDYILFRNFLAAVRESPAYRGRPLVLCGYPALRDLVRTVDGACVDDFISLDDGQGGYRRRFALLAALKRLGPSVVLTPTLGRFFMGTDAFARATGAPERIGLAEAPSEPTWSEKTGWINWNPRLFQRLGDRCYTRLVQSPKELLFEFERTRIFFRAVLGDVPLPVRPSLAPVPVEIPALPGRFALLLPGASQLPREWPAENFGRVARHLTENHGLAIAVTGTAGDVEKAQCIARVSGVPVLDLAGRLDLVQLVAVMARAEFVLTNESAGGHLASALRRKAVAIATDGSLITFHPYPPELEPTVRFVYPPAIRQAPSLAPFAGRTTAGIPAAEVEVEAVIAEVDAVLRGD
jgi:ADP-heptose:LPS heptosyltransferase